MAHLVVLWTRCMCCPALLQCCAAWHAVTSQPSPAQPCRAALRAFPPPYAVLHMQPASQPAGLAACSAGSGRALLSRCRWLAAGWLAMLYCDRQTAKPSQALPCLAGLIPRPAHHHLLRCTSRQLGVQPASRHCKPWQSAAEPLLLRAVRGSYNSQVRIIVPPGAVGDHAV